MSRKEWNNEQFQFVAGVDRVTGPFIQIWLQPVEDQDCAEVVIDNQGCRASGSWQLLPPALTAFLRSQLWPKGRDLSADATITIASLLGFGNLSREIYALWD